MQFTLRFIGQVSHAAKLNYISEGYILLILALSKHFALIIIIVCAELFVPLQPETAFTVPCVAMHITIQYIIK